MIAHPTFRWEARAFAQYMLVLVLVLAQAAPLPQWAGLPLYPHILLLAVYYWSVFQPQKAHPALLFFFGLIHDVLVGSPLGLHALLLLLLRALIISQRRLFLAQQFVFVWIGMAITAALGYGALWVCAQAISGGDVPLMDFVLPALTTTLFYPLWHRLCDIISHPSEK